METAFTFGPIKASFFGGHTFRERLCRVPIPDGDIATSNQWVLWQVVFLDVFGSVKIGPIEDRIELKRGLLLFSKGAICSRR